MRLITLFFATALVACTEKETETETENTVIDADGDGVAEADDCDDSNADINPQAEEICDGLDNNCDDEIDNDASDVQSFYEDADGDGAGDPEVVIEACEAPEDYVDNSDDCDDFNATVYLGAEEICDGLDNNCDTEIDEDLELLTFYEDFDGDSFGDPDVTMEDCIAAEGYVDNMMDCDDSNADIGSSETDMDCDGLLNEEDDDMDGDGLTGDEECNDSDASMVMLQNSVETTSTDLDGDGIPESVETLTYDEYGNILSSSISEDLDGDGNMDELLQVNNYNEAGNISSVDFTYDYNTDGDIEISYTSVVTYDADDNIVSVIANGTRVDGSTFEFTRNYTYDGDGNQLTYMFNADWNGDGTPDQSMLTNYSYDADGQMTDQTIDNLNADGAELIDGVAEETYTYTYDADGNMATLYFVQDTDSDGNADAIQDRAYTYTSFGETETMTIAYDWDGDEEVDVNYTFSYTYNADNQVERFERVWIYVLEMYQAYNGFEVTTYSYNENGDLLMTEFDGENDGEIDTTYTNTYNEDGQLVTEETEDGTMSYTYLPCM